MSKYILLVQPKYHTRFPPLGLLKISSYMKNKGYKTKLVYGEAPIKRKPKEIWVTSLYTYAWKPVHRAIKYYQSKFQNVPIKLGGIYASLLPNHAKNSGAEIIEGIIPEVEKYKPDYSLVPNWDGSILFTSRGCINKCPFCAVPKLEGKFRSEIDSIYDYIELFHKRIIFWDNNILASPNIFKIIDELYKLGKKVDFNQGLDSRLITNELGENLSKLKIPLYRFGYDSSSYKKRLENAISILKENGVRGRNVLLYVLFNYKDTPEKFLEKVRDAFKWGVVCYPMRYQPTDCLKKNTFISKNWTKEELDYLARARRVMGYGGAFPPYNRLVEKIEKANNFNEAFEVWPINWRESIKNTILNKNKISNQIRPRNPKFGNSLSDDFISKIGIKN